MLYYLLKAGVFDEDCIFQDPTIKFQGKNLSAVSFMPNHQILKRSLTDLKLYSIKFSSLIVP
jgi:hypothetical protein